MGRYKKEYDINYYFLDKNQEATPSGIINMLQDTAVWHSEAVGLGLKKLEADGIVWILNRWHIEIDTPLKWNTRVTVETWPSSFNRFYATREFVIRDAADNILLRASSRWILLNIEKKRPVRVPAEFYSLYGMDSEERAVAAEFSNLQQPDASTPGEVYKIRRSDLDTNQHVNNTKYVEWILETIPDDVYKEYRLKTIEVSYVKDTQSGMIECLTEQAGDEEVLWTGTHLVRQHGAENSAELALARTVWQTRI